MNHSIMYARTFNRLAPLALRPLCFRPITFAHATYQTTTTVDQGTNGTGNFLHDYMCYDHAITFPHRNC